MMSRAPVPEPSAPLRPRSACAVYLAIQPTVRQLGDPTRPGEGHRRGLVFGVLAMCLNSFACSVVEVSGSVRRHSTSVTCVAEVETSKDKSLGTAARFGDRLSAQQGPDLHSGLRVPR